MKPGYMIQITSWENDADNYRTVTKVGLSVTAAKFMVEFAQLFKNCWHNGGLAANAYDENDVKWPELIEAVRALFKKYPGMYDELWGDDGEDSMNDPDEDYLGDEYIKDTIHELAYDLFGASEFFFRVFDKYAAYYIPEEIKEVKFDFSPFGG